MGLQIEPSRPRLVSPSPAQQALIRRMRLLSVRLRQPDVFGSYRSSFRGSGLEFAEIRALESGDDVRFMDWNSTARTRRPHLRVYHEERAIRVVLVFDHGPSMNAPGLGRPKAEISLDVAGIFALSALANGDRIGWHSFAADQYGYQPPSAGRRYMWHMLRQIAQLPRATRAQAPSEIIDTLAKRHRRRSVIIWLSDHIYPPETDEPRSLIPRLRALARRHEVVMIAINDPIEWELEERGLIWCTTGTVGAQPVLLDSSSGAVRDEYRRRGRAIRAMRKHLWRQSGVRWLELSTVADPLENLLAFLRVAR